MSRVDKDVVFGREAQPPFTIWNSIANPPFDPTPLHHGADFIDGNASLIYGVTPQINAYASYARQQSGAFYGAYAASPNRLRKVLVTLSVKY